MTAFGHRRKRAELPTPVALGQAAFPKLAPYPGAGRCALDQVPIRSWARRGRPEESRPCLAANIARSNPSPVARRPNEPDADTPTLSERTRAPEGRTNPADAAPGPLAL